MSNPYSPQGVQGITEDDIANYLASHHEFFSRHAELLATVQLASPHGQRAVSLQERQMEMLRERHKGLERQIIDMSRHARENMLTQDRLHRWTLALLQTEDDSLLPQVALEEMRHEFMIPAAAIRLWGVAPAHADHVFAQAVSDDARSFVGSLTQPYCGVNSGFEAVQWLPEPATIKSLALIPLRHANAAIGLLVLGSPDVTRYSADMGTDFLQRMGDLASAAFARLLPDLPINS